MGQKVISNQCVSSQCSEVELKFEEDPRILLITDLLITDYFLSTPHPEQVTPCVPPAPPCLGQTRGGECFLLPRVER
jgi:hypothetical protein